MSDQPTIFDHERNHIRTLEAELTQAREDARVLAAEVSQWREKSRVNEAWKGDRLILSRLYRGEFLSTSFEKAMRTTNASGALERNKP